MIQFVLVGYILLGAAALASIIIRGLFERARAWHRRSAMSWALPENPDVVITLVHGTWGRHTPWTNVTSPLCRALLDLGDRVALVPFGWSGRNRAEARSRASEQLRVRLAELVARYPGASHYVIAHSHGGNIALYALRDWHLSDRIAGIVCLSTPFLCLRRRALGPITSRSLAASLVVGPWLLAGTLLPRLGMTEDTAILVSLPVVGVAAWAVLRWSKVATERLLASLALPNQPPAPTLILRAQGDEAGAALASVHFLSWMVNACWVRPAMVAADLADVVRQWGARARAFRGVASTVAALCIAAGVAEYVWSPFRSIAPPSLQAATMWVWALVLAAALTTLLVWWFGAGAGLYGYIVGLSLTGLLLVPFILLLVVCVAPFGPDLALAAVPLEITAEPTPPGRWVVHQLSADRSRTGEAASEASLVLRHSSYENLEAIALVAGWMRTRIRG